MDKKKRNNILTAVLGASAVLLIIIIILIMELAPSVKAKIVFADNLKIARNSRSVMITDMSSGSYLPSESSGEITLDGDAAAAIRDLFSEATGSTHFGDIQKNEVGIWGYRLRFYENGRTVDFFICNDSIKITNDKEICIFSYNESGIASRDALISAITDTLK